MEAYPQVVEAPFYSWFAKILLSEMDIGFCQMLFCSSLKMIFSFSLVI